MSPADTPHPEFLNAAQCKAWLVRAPMTNTAKAQGELLQQLNLLNLQALPAGERLAILELLRKPIMLVQREAARRFVGRPLPLSPVELAAYESTQALWQSLLVGYRHCLLATLEDGAPADAAVPIVRALGVLADSQFDAYRAGYQPRPEHWRNLHEVFGTAERLGIAGHEVTDEARMGKSPFPLCASYAEAMLLHAASPFELPQRHLTWVGNWARRWSAKVAILSAPPADAKAISLCADLASSEPAGYLAVRGAGARWLDTSALRTSLRKRIALLDSGAEPVTLQLGSDCVQPACGILLRQTYGRWCKGGSPRGQERQPASGKCELISGTEAAHFHVSGRKPFTQPGHVSDDTLRREREEIATFGRIHTHAAPPPGQAPGYQADQWQVVEEWQLQNQSAAGVHVAQRADQLRTRIAQGQLVALLPEGSQAPLLGSLRWVMMGADAKLHVGLMIVPGRPQAVAVCVSGTENAPEPYRPGFLLPAVPALATPASVVVPAGWFKADRRLGIYTDRSRQIRLVELLERGADYDRVSFEDTE